MLFQTPEFLVLFAVSILGLVVLRRKGQQHVFLAALSYAFYAWLDVRFLILLLITSLVDYAAALGMDGVRLSWKKRYALSAFVVVMGVVTLGLNWPLVQGAGRVDAFSLAAFVRPEWKGVGLSLGACGVFALVWPLVYEWLVRVGSEERRRRGFLVASVVSNLVVLAFFKYFNFFADATHALAERFGVSIPATHLDVLLPMGISFYTFVSMSYTIDAYRRHLVPERSFTRFSLFVCYFPHLVAGPIIRPENFLPTLEEPWTLRSSRVLSGFHLCLNGLFKKVLIADTVARLVESIFSDPSLGANSLSVMLGAVCFAVQIYCDFSGYSDIARGVSRILGPELPENFDFPYTSTSIIEFWRRWHISLSTWLRDYLYIPLGGGRASPPRVYVNLMITMVLGGLWHGASANFVVWGFYQGLLLCANRLVRWLCGRVPALAAALESRVGTVVRWGVTMYFVLLGWLIFRVNNAGDPFDFRDLWYCVRKFVVFDGDFQLSSIGLGWGRPVLAVACVGVFCVLHACSARWGRWYDRMDRLPLWALAMVYALLAVVFFFFWPTSAASFIYFQF